MLSSYPYGPPAVIVDSSASSSEATPRKQAVSEAAQIVPVRTVLATIGEYDSTRRLVLDGFKARGGSLDAWHRSDRQAMADAITHAEDVLEMRHAEMRRCSARAELETERMKLRDLRRRLECEALT